MTEVKMVCRWCGQPIHRSGGVNNIGVWVHDRTKRNWCRGHRPTLFSHEWHAMPLAEDLTKERKCTPTSE